jgi:ubiquinone/menaquinone biosynthesis C-methylase UbiE
VAENLSKVDNESRFVDYPYDLHETWWNDMQKRKMRAMCARVRPGETVLDVGCNSGYIVEFLPPGCVAHGVDLSPDLVSKAAKRLATAQVAGAEELPFPDKSMDVVVFAGVIEYVFDPAQAMRELARVARRIILVEANHEKGVWGAHRIAQHAYMVRSYDEDALRKELSAVGTVTWMTLVGMGSEFHHRIMEVAL